MEMHDFPDELAFTSLFSVEPTLLDKNEELPFYYNESRFIFENDCEAFDVRVSPGYGEFSVLVTEKETGRFIAHHDYLSVEKLEIKKDTKQAAEIFIVLGHASEDLMTMIEMSFRPRYSVIVKEMVR